MLNNSDQYFNAKSLKGLDAVLYFKGYPRAPLKVRDQQYRSWEYGVTCALTLIGIPNRLEEDKASDDYDHNSVDTNTVKSLIQSTLGSTIEIAQGNDLGLSELSLDKQGVGEYWTAMGQYLSAGNDIIGRTVKKIGFSLKKVGSATGDITFTIRSGAGGAVLASKVWGDASLLTTDFAWCEVTLTTAYQVAATCSLCVEYDGGTDVNYIEAQYIRADLIKNEDFIWYSSVSGWVDYPYWECKYYYKYDQTAFGVFDHCEVYTAVFDEEDALIDAYMPKGSFSIKAGESRQNVIQKLVQYTGCEGRWEKDGQFHVLIPPTASTSFTYQLGGDYPFLVKTERDALTIPNKITVQSRENDSPQYSGTTTDATSYALLPVEATPVETILESDDQAEAIAEAILARFQVAKFVGSAQVPLIVGDETSEIFDRQEVIDLLREGLETEGNIGYLDFRYQPGLLLLNFTFGNIVPKPLPGTRLSYLPKHYYYRSVAPAYTGWPGKAAAKRADIAAYKETAPAGAGGGSVTDEMIETLGLAEKKINDEMIPHIIANREDIAKILRILEKYNLE